MDAVWQVLFIAQWLVVVLLAVFLVAILRVLGGLQQQVDLLAEQQLAPPPLTLNTPLADGTYTSVTGEVLRLSEMWHQGRLLLFFVSTGCVPCRDMLRRFGELYGEAIASGWSACILCLGPEPLVRYLIEDANLPRSLPVAAVDQESIARTYGVLTTPTVVATDAHGLVRGVIVGPSDDEQLRQLLFRQFAPPLVAR